ncbi:MAG: AraC family transcriptional regulator [Flavobacteriaceae bacterium]|nr:AraC family transcriptional regulator [Flavobacteriaceae bacterium]
MKVFPFLIANSINKAFVYKEDIGKQLYNKLHQHNEIQLSLIYRGEGTLVVNDVEVPFGEGDIIAIGQHVPHCFLNRVQSDKQAHVISLFLSKEVFEKQLLALEELHPFLSLFEAFDSGVKWVEKHKELESLFLRMRIESTLERFLSGLRLLQILVQGRYKILSSYNIRRKLPTYESKRMQQVVEYTLEYYSRQISLEEIADIANMAPNSFCRYFKNRTDKTYFQYLTEVRIENVCRLLREEKDANIAEICLRSGFNNISNFNRKFKSIKNCTPRSYKQQNITRKLMQTV